MKQLLNKYMEGLFGYLIVGGLATIVEWAGFWLFSEKMGITYLLATTFAFAISTFANWLFCRHFCSGWIGIGNAVECNSRDPIGWENRSKHSLPETSAHLLTEDVSSI